MTKLENDYQQKSLETSMNALNQASNQKADFANDLKEMEEGSFSRPDVIDGAPSESGEPAIRHITPQERAQFQMTNAGIPTEPGVEAPVETPAAASNPLDLDQERRLKNLYSNYGRENVDTMIQFETVFPAGYTLEMALSDKQTYRDIYLQSLPSGFYVFRPLFKMDLDAIKGIKGMTEELMPAHIVRTCVLFPSMNAAQVEGSSAGTVKTLTDLIYMYSDFMSQQTEAPMKL